MMSNEDQDSGRKSNGFADEERLTRSRTRVSRACTRCRNRKDKCDGRRPFCSACVSADQICSYEPATKKRGLPEGYVRGLEKLWAILIRKIEGLEEAVVRVLGDDHDVLSQIWNHHHHGEELHSMWKESRVLQELENLLAGLDHHTSTSKRKRDREDDEEGNDTPDPTLDLSLCLNTQFHVQPISDTASSLSHGRTYSGFPHPLTTTDKVTLPPMSSKVLTHYFIFTHSWLPILDRPHVLKRCYEFSKSEVVVDHSNADLAVLSAVLAYTTQQMSGSEHGSSAYAPPSVEAMATVSRRCIPATDGPFSIGHVQALLILALLDIGLGRWTSAWLTVGQAVRAMLELAETTRVFGRAESATYQGCFVIDTLVSLRLGRVPELRRTGVEARSLMQEDGHEEWEPWTGPNSDALDQREPAFSISSFNRLTELFMIINDCITYPATDSRDLRHTFFEQKMLELNNLSVKYPFPLSDSSARPPHQIWLQLSHISATGWVSSLATESDSTATKAIIWINTILDVCSNTTAIGLQVMPTLLMGMFHSVSQIPTGLGHGNLASTSDISFNSAVSGFVARLSQMPKAWPEIENLARGLKDRPDSHSSRAFSHGGPSASKKQKTLSQDLGLSPGIQNQLNLWPSDPFAFSFPTAGGITSAPVAISDRQSNTIDIDSPFGVARTPANFRLDSITSPSAPGSYGTMNLGTPDQMHVDSRSMTQNMPGGIAMPSVATSPSFQGDEIDALFHEMAQLDTTEWTSGRTQGLKDFGFTDDLTFEAFCNDPDRLMSSNAFDQQGFVESVPGSTQSYVPPNILHHNHRPSGNSFDMITGTWAG